MSLADDIAKLHSLKIEGALSEEEFSRAKAQLLNAPSANPEPKAASALNDFARSSRDAWIAGVCGGIAEQTNLPSWLWRIAFVLLTLLHGVGLVLYLLLWIFVPRRQEPRATFQN